MVDFNCIKVLCNNTLLNDSLYNLDAFCLLVHHSHLHQGEAICTRLCEQITQPQRGGVQLVDQFTLRDGREFSLSMQRSGRVMNCQELMEKTGSHFFELMKRTLTRWYKNLTRREEIQILMQGLRPPNAPACASDALPAPGVHPASRVPPHEPKIFCQPEDKTGRARVGSKGKLNSVCC